MEKKMSNKFSSPLSRNGSVSSTSSRSPMERKEALRTFLTRTRALHEVNPQTVKSLEEMIKETDTISLEASIDDKASCQDEVLMDSEIMTASSKVLKNGTTSLTKELSPYVSRDFAEKLLIYVHMLPDTTMDKPNWAMLENEVTKIFKRTPNFSTLSGCLEPLEKKVVVKRQPVKRDAQAPTTRPKAIVSVEKNEDGLEQTVEKIRLLISRTYKEDREPIDYFRLILHPTDFGKTIENMLHVAFLVRDGIIQSFLDDNGVILIKPASKDMQAEFKKSGKKVNVQNILFLSIQQWRTLKEAYKITSPMINFQ